jgi:Domain of unknown function (DUF4282)
VISPYSDKAAVVSPYSAAGQDNVNAIVDTSNRREAAMAGQPPEPTFQPSGQDRDRDREAGLTQGRPAWQQQPNYSQPEPGYQPGPGYSQPAGPGQQAYAAPSYSQPPDPGYAAQERGYSTPDQGYAAAEQPGYGGQGPAAYGAPGQASAQPDQGYPGYQPPGYSQPGQGQGQPGQGAGSAQWQGIAGVKSATAKPRSGEKGFLGSLFDFSFSSLVTPKIIKFIYVLLVIWTALVAIFFLIIGFRTGGLAGGLFTLIIVEPIFILLTLGIWRVVLEAFMVVFRIYEETKKIAENAASRD